MQNPHQFSTPTQGFVGGIGIAISATLLLYATGRTLGVSGFIHRSARSSSPFSSNARQGDIIAVLGILLCGVCIGALEANYSRPSGSREGAQVGTDSFGGASAFSELAPVALAGLLSGFGTKCSNGCTSGHMVCGLSRFSPRSAVATLVFFSVASLTTQFRRQSLPPIEGYDWSLGAIGTPLLQILGGVITMAVLLLIIISYLKGSSHRRGLERFFNGLVVFFLAFAFALALRLSTLNSPAKVTSFLIMPFSDPQIFDSTMAFLALGCLPLAAVLYSFGAHLQARGRSSQKSAGGATKPNGVVAASEQDPLIAPKQAQSPFEGTTLPVLDGCAWPGTSSSVIDKKLITGSILFGVGWGMLGICPGPAILNFGTSLYSLARGEPDAWLVQGGVWLATFVAGGLVAP